eukprot:GDKJ01042267.1.p1 GENE.GDKJ01042267.1~~GDKJ01042267.1.p1  ORF type:complete len:465 (-),score=113.05 GDKJ01042267.1:358-1752(-)
MRDGRCVFYLTSFGCFDSIKENPTEKVVPQLMDNIFETHTCAGYKNLQVSMKCVQESIFTIHMISNGFCRPSDIPVIIHFGVASSIQKIHLEQFSYNMADFRVPDECGAQPSKEKIIPDGIPTSETQLPVFDVLKDLNDPNLFEVSADPGRFVCNYLYYVSNQLSKTCQNQQMTVLFVHIPPFETIPEATCLEALTRLCNSISNVLEKKFPSETILLDVMKKNLRMSSLRHLIPSDLASPQPSPSRTVTAAAAANHPRRYFDEDEHEDEMCRLPLSLDDLQTEISESWHAADPHWPFDETHEADQNGDDKSKGQLDEKKENVVSESKGNVVQEEDFLTLTDNVKVTPITNAQVKALIESSPSLSSFSSSNNLKNIINVKNNINKNVNVANKNRNSTSSSSVLLGKVVTPPIVQKRFRCDCGCEPSSSVGGSSPSVEKMEDKREKMNEISSPSTLNSPQRKWVVF